MKTYLKLILVKNSRLYNTGLLFQCLYSKHRYAHNSVYYRKSLRHNQLLPPKENVFFRWNKHQIEGFFIHDSQLHFSTERERNMKTVWEFHPLCPYQVLKVQRTSSNKEVKDSFIKLSQIYHPDKNAHLKGNKTQKEKISNEFVKVKAAYDLLSNPSKRKSFDWYSSLVYQDEFPIKNSLYPSTATTAFHGNPHDFTKSPRPHYQYHDQRNSTPKEMLKDDLKILLPFIYGFGTVVICCMLMDNWMAQDRIDQEKLAWEQWYSHKKEQGLDDLVLTPAPPLPPPHTTHPLPSPKFTSYKRYNSSSSINHHSSETENSS